MSYTDRLTYFKFSLQTSYMSLVIKAQLRRITSAMLGGLKLQCLAIATFLVFIFYRTNSLRQTALQPPIKCRPIPEVRQ